MVEIMKIYKSKQECENAALEACIKHTLNITDIDEGSYKGGLYDCLFIINPNTHLIIFEGAY